jgi:hypothetical protein
LIALLGISHPPTANDNVPLKPFRHFLGWATLLFVFIGFVPAPLSPDGYEPGAKPVWYCLEMEGMEKITFQSASALTPSPPFGYNLPATGAR